MKRAFIINPASGNGRKARKLEASLRLLQEKTRAELRCYRTVAEGDAEVLSARLAEEAASAGEEIAIYACGGDGTVHEVVNGLVRHPNALLGVLPIGSGNDFVRCFEDPGAFLDLERQLRAEPMEIDVMEYSREQDGHQVTSCYINGINIGFDGNTAILAHQLKELPAVNGTFSYILAAAMNLIRKKGENLRVFADGALIHEGPLMLCTAANGRFCGGGFESCPRALLDNGKIELLVVKDITRRFFVRVVPKYRAGKLFDIDGVDAIATSLQAEEVRIEPAAGRMKFVADGEILETGAITIRVLPGAIRLLVPSGAQD